MTSSSGSPPPDRSAACPNAEVLAGLALGEGETDSRRALADHVVGCPACAADFRLLRELHREASGARPGGWVRSRRTWLVAGLAAVLVGISLVPLLQREPVDVRGPVASVTPPDGAVLEAPPAALAWQAVPGALGYRVKLFRGDSTPAWESGVVSDPTVSLPAEVRAGMGGGGSWYWTVESLGPVHRRRTGPSWFQLRPS